MRPQDLLALLAEDSDPSDTDSHHSCSSFSEMAPRLPGETTKTSSSSVPSRSVKDQHALEEARRNATPGQYWISNKNGEDCPVVICDEDMMVRYFTERLGHNGALKKVHPCLYAGTLDWYPSPSFQGTPTSDLLIVACGHLRKICGRFR